MKGTTGNITIQEGGFLYFLRPLMTGGLPLMKYVLTPLAKSVLIPLELTAAVSARDVAIQNKISGSGRTALITFNKEMDYTMKIVKSLEETTFLLIKSVRETNKNEAKEQKGGFFLMLLGILAAILLGRVLADKEVARAGRV